MIELDSDFYWGFISRFGDINFFGMESILEPLFSIVFYLLVFLILSIPFGFIFKILSRCFKGD